MIHEPAVQTANVTVARVTLRDEMISALRRARVMMIIAVVFLMNAVAFAQTAVPVEIEIPTDDMMTHLNTWIQTFAPIVLLFGMIPVALGLLRYITKLFQQAFSGGGR